MLKSLRFESVGPAPKLKIEFHERLNFLAGDNGLGKTFLLDVAWWALARTWARTPVVPHAPPAEPLLGYRYGTADGRLLQYTSTFDRLAESWSVPQGQPPIPGMGIYAQVDGGFSVWDPVRPQSYAFTAKEVWEGNELCEGLIRDWALWQSVGGDAFAQLKSVLETLSPSPSEFLEPGELRKISLDDPRRHPTLKMPYGQEVALIHASAGMRRIVALAYLLVWTWQGHLEACKLLGRTPTKEIIFLIDEIEAHLHPQWQRRIVTALLKVMEALTGDHDVKVQLITATHSPLVLASVEPSFDEARDGLFLLGLKDQQVTLEEQVWTKQGDVVNWLVSDTFGLQQGRSLEAERAIAAAGAWMRGDQDTLPEDLTSASTIDTELKRVLPGHDPFWPRWVLWVERNEQEETPPPPRRRTRARATP